MIIKKTDFIKNVLTENVQMADKIYFKSGKLSTEEQVMILNITKKDNTSKLMCDFFLELKNSHESESKIPKILQSLHQGLISYNKNIFPIEGFDLYNQKNELSYDIILAREEILNGFKRLPSIAIRNMKQEIRIPRNWGDMDKYARLLEYFLTQYSQLGNRDEALKKKIHQKMFASNVTLQALINFADEKENLLGGHEFTKEQIEEIIQDTYSIEKIYETANKMVLEIDDPQGIKVIGCNSLWCFTYGSGFDQAWRQWNNYSHNGIVYVIIDFTEPSDSPQFMHVVIAPLPSDDKYADDYEGDDEEDYDDDAPSIVFNMGNEAQYDPLTVLSNLIGLNKSRELLTFGEEPDED